MKQADFKSFVNKNHEFSLEVNCSECNHKFVQRFILGKCHDCCKKFDDKVKVKVEELKNSGKSTGIEWQDILKTAIEVSRSEENKKNKT